MRRTLLEIVQEILSALDSDEVNSISDTVESNQVALIVKSVYYDCAVDFGLPEHETLFQLQASQNPAQPCVMQVPSTVVTLRQIKYDQITPEKNYSDYVEVKYKPFNEFLEWQNYLRIEQDNVAEQSITFNNVEDFKFMYRTNKMPEFYTTADDQQIIFDGIDLDIDTTLQRSKTMCRGNVYPEFNLVDNFMPDLDPSQFPFLVNRAKVRAFNELKQQLNEEAIAESRRQKIIIQKRKQKTPDGPARWKTPRYGR